jgi:hypothetical protein
MRSAAECVSEMTDDRSLGRLLINGDEPMSGSRATSDIDLHIRAILKDSRRRTHE